MAQLVERAHPNASPMEKFYAMKAGMKLLGGSGQQQFSQMMQLLQYQRQEEAAGRAERREERQLHADERRDQQFGLTQVKSDPRYKELSTSMTNMRKRLDVVDELQDKTIKIGDRLLELANQKSQSGSPVWQAFINLKGKVTGDPLIKEFQTQVETYSKDMARLLGSPGATVLPVSTQNEMRGLIPENVTPQQLQAIQKALKYDAKVGRQASQKIYDRDFKNMQQLYQQRGITLFPVEEPDAGYTKGEETETGSAPVTVPSGVTITPIR